VIQYLWNAVFIVLTPLNFGILLISVFSGLVMGMLPGLSATMAVALLTGLTYKLPHSTALISLVGVYVGAISGGCQSAILLNIPGTPASAGTALDGFPLARKGEGGFAIFLATTASWLGTTLSILCVMTLTPPLTYFSLKFGVWEFFLLSIFGIVICGNLTSGGNPLKGWISGILGLLVAQIGIDTINAFPRWSYGNVNLMGSIQLIPVMIGLFGFPEIINAFRRGGNPIQSMSTFRIRDGFRTVLKNWIVVIRSALIGVGVGIIPGVGEDVGGWLSYWASRATSKEPESFGKGNPTGIISVETGNNSCIGGAIIPILSLAVPGSAPAAVLMAAFMMHGYRPGPLLMMETPEFLYQICMYLFFSAFTMWALGLVLAKLSVRILGLRKEILMPVVYVLCVLGSYAINYNMFDIRTMFVFGMIGFLMNRMKYPASPFLLGVILGPMADSNLRRALTITDGSFLPMFKRPISVFFLIVIACLILSQTVLFKKIKKRG